MEREWACDSHKVSRILSFPLFKSQRLQLSDEKAGLRSPVVNSCFDVDQGTPQPVPLPFASFSPCLPLLMMEVQ